MHESPARTSRRRYAHSEDIPVRIRDFLLALALLPMGWLPLPAQDAPKKPADAFRAARDYLQVGSLELAAGTLKDFADLKPTDQDYLDIESKYGANVFQNLRNVPRWLADAKKDEEFKKTVVESIIDGSLKANAKLTRDPVRLQKFARNLGESKEERDFAIAELNRAGAAAVPPILENLRINNTPEYRAGALTAVERLSADTVPGFVVATENLPDELKVGIIRSLARRSDVLALLGKADTNFVPFLWYLSTSDQPGALRDSATETLRSLSGDRSDRQQVDSELVKYASPMFDRKGIFAGFDGVRNRVALWSWDAATGTVKLADLTKSQAEEQYGLKYLKWAIERRPDSRPAIDLFLSLATERAVERSNFGDLAKQEAGVTTLLASAPAETLNDLLISALSENRTALAYGLTQALGNRSEKSAAISSKDRAAPLVKALNYSDPRVQLAAATAILKMPAVEHGANARIVEVLSRAANTEAGSSADTKGKALVVDPVAGRGDRVATLVRGLGYDVEVFGTGRGLFKRINRSADFDLVLIDRHVVDPELKDVLAALKANANAGRRPVLVVASPDAAAPPNAESLLLRLAVLLAVTETTEIEVPGPYQNDKRKPKEENDDVRKRNIQDRDARLMLIADARLARMKRIVDAATLGNSVALQTRLELRLPQLVLAGLIAEYDSTPEFAPTPYRNVRNYTDLIRKQSNLDNAVADLPTDTLLKLMAQLETVLNPEMRTRLDKLLARIDVDELALPRPPSIDPIVEAKLNRMVKAFPGVTVIAEPFATGSVDGSVKFGLAHEIQATVADPAQRPRDPAEKKSSLKSAVEWLRRLANGERSGYDLTPAIPTLRAALANDDVAELAVEALGRLASADAQRDLARLGATASRPAALRLAALETTIRHIQANGKMTIPEVDQVVATAQTAETNVEIKSKLAILTAVLSGKSGDLVDKIQRFAVPAAAAPAKAPDPKPVTENKQQ
jgi:CheY-like chemotaxis protein